MIGEHLWLGNAGKFLLLLSFFMAIFSGIVYSMSTRLKHPGDISRFKRAGQWGFLFHSSTLTLACIVLSYLLFHHYFEYAYVWKYSSAQMPFRYAIACFWAGQEGSFMLWGFWQALLGVVVMFLVHNKEPHVMAIIAFAQAALLTTVLGIDFGFRMGTSPFTLLRNLPESMGNEFFKNPDYLSFIHDGVGLNPLLENFWMICHPPALFLGYAATLISFSFALASLWKGDFIGGLKNGIQWSLWAILTLFIGIVIGGAWAYKSLTFAGFWAWDPVENASLVPLLLLVAGLHFLLIAKKRNHALKWGYGFIIFSYVMVWYASFLTRSGILGQTSVHAFGDNGMKVHLAIITTLFLLAGLSFFVLRYKKSPVTHGTNLFLTKDFFILAGSMVLALSAFQITMATSMPVWNKLFGFHIASPADPVSYYNGWQIPFAILVLLLVAGVQYFNQRQILVPLLISGAATIFMALFTDYRQPLILSLFFAAILSASASLVSLLNLRRLSASPGSLVTHTGFAIFILGALLAFSNSRVISNVERDVAPDTKIQQDGSVVLFRGKAVKLKEYFVVYSNRLKKGDETLYQIDFFRDAKIKDKLFTLYPTIQQNEKMGAVYNPATHNFPDKDVFTFISHAGLTGVENGVANEGDAGINNETFSEKNDLNDFNLVSRQNIALNQKLPIGSYLISLDSLWLKVYDKEYKDVDIMARLNVVHPALGSRKVECSFLKRGDQSFNRDAVINAWGLALRFEMTSDQPNKIKLGVYKQKPDFIVLKAIIFPWMNIMWLGVLLLLAGLMVSLYKRLANWRR